MTQINDIPLHASTCGVVLSQAELELLEKFKQSGKDGVLLGGCSIFLHPLPNELNFLLTLAEQEYNFAQSTLNICSGENPSFIRAIFKSEVSGGLLYSDIVKDPDKVYSQIQHFKDRVDSKTQTSMKNFFIYALEEGWSKEYIHGVFRAISFKRRALQQMEREKYKEI